MEQKKKKFTAPHTFVILVCMMILAIIATHFVPAGAFERVKDEATGKTLVQAGSYHLIDPTPVSIFSLPGIIYRAIVDAADIVAFIIVIGGAFEIINSTGTIAQLCKKMAKVLKGKEMLVIPIFLTVFSIFGFTMGMSTEVMIFVPIGIALAASLGMDRVTGTAMIAMGAATGFTSGLLNPFNVGVAQAIAELPLFSGIGYRALVLVVLLIIDTAYIIWYEKRVKADPAKSIVYGLEIEDDFTFEDEDSALSKSNIAVLLILVVGFGSLFYGLTKLGWWYEEMAAVFLTMGVASGFVSGYSPSKVARVFGAGTKGIVVGALIVGFARGVEIIFSDANIIDTIVNAIATAVSSMPHAVQAVGMFLAQSLVNCMITSGSGQAVVTMPLMVPVADLVGISRQTAVLAFQLGDGFSNSILPMSSSLMGFLVVSKIPYEKWLKFMVPLFLLWTLAGCLFMIGAVAIGY